VENPQSLTPTTGIAIEKIVADPDETLDVDEELNEKS
jgi:hypothetical protein